MRLPIRVRLTVWYVTLLALILVALGGFLLLRLRTDLVAGIDRSLDTRAALITLNYDRGGGESEFQGLSESALVSVPHGETADQILSPSGEVVEAAGDQTVAGAAMIGAAGLAQALGGSNGDRINTRLGPDREPFRVLAVRVPNQSQVLVVSESLDEVLQSIHRLLVLMLIGGPAALVAAGAGGWWLAGKGLRPVSRMTEEAAAIGVNRLDERVAVPTTSDEIERLGRTLNAMLDRLELGVAEKRRFLADASHELRTPLAVMRSEIDVTLGSDELAPAARGVLESAGEEVDRMTGTVENLLTLARIDEGGLQLLRTPVELRGVARGVAVKLHPLAEAKRIDLSVTGEGAFVEGDRERLSQAVANLVDNALKYTDPGGRVEISVWHRGPESGLTVADTGPGIAAETLPRIFDRFVRADGARSRTEGGSGLGLAIYREIIEAHGGHVWAESQVGQGSAISFALPSSSLSRNRCSSGFPSHEQA